ncbi:MAG TPA: hypothetical protein VI282_06655 [Verrucomicrobiae bacterium]|jgi:hypothetical protein
MTTLPIAVGLTHDAERELERAFRRLAARHSSDFEIEQGCKLFSRWARNHRQRLGAAIEKHGKASNSDPARLGRALFHGLRVGGFGLLRDLQDLLTLVHRARNDWTVLTQAAKEIRDTQLAETATEIGKEIDIMIDWVCAHIKIAAPQALTVPVDLPAELRGSIPRKMTTAVLPRVNFGSSIAVGVTFVAGLLAARALTARK